MKRQPAMTPTTAFSTRGFGGRRRGRGATLSAIARIGRIDREEAAASLRGRSGSSAVVAGAATIRDVLAGSAARSSGGVRSSVGAVPRRAQSSTEWAAGAAASSAR
jgi:hypothetical protein